MFLVTLLTNMLTAEQRIIVALKSVEDGKKTDYLGAYGKLCDRLQMAQSSFLTTECATSCKHLAEITHISCHGIGLLPSWHALQTCQEVL